MSRVEGALPVRPSVAAGVVSMAASAAVPWLGWVRTGSAVRNSYEIFRSAQRLGLEELTPLRVLWFLLPVLAAAAALLGIIERRRSCAALVAVVGLIVGGAGLVVVLSPAGAGAGPWAGIIVGVTSAASAVWILQEPQGPVRR